MIYNQNSGRGAPAPQHLKSFFFFNSANDSVAQLELRTTGLNHDITHVKTFFYRFNI